MTADTFGRKPNIYKTGVHQDAPDFNCWLPNAASN